MKKRPKAQQPKNSFFIFVLILLLFSLTSYAQSNSYKNPSTCENHNAFNKLSATNQLGSLVADRLPNGTIFLNPDKIDSLPQMLSNMGVNIGSTFALALETPSRLDSSKIFRQYTQNYNGILVEGAGYTISYRKSGPGHYPDNPCVDDLQAYMFYPYLLTDIDVPTTPIIPSTSLPILLNGPIYGNPSLVISHNLNNNCEYNLAWKVDHESDGAKTSWVNALSGNILKTMDSDLSLSAPTENYGPKDLDDITINNQTRLESPNGKIKLFDLISQGGCPIFVGNGFSPTAIPSTMGQEWTNETSPAAFQAFWSISEAISKYAEIGIVFNNVNVISCQESRALFMNGATFQDVFISVGRKFGVTLALHDILAHELGHAYVNQFLGKSNAPRSLQEGICDILGTYIESKIQDFFDWKMGDDRIKIEEDLRRNLAIPPSTADHFSEVKDIDEPHLRSQILGYWYYLVSNGSTGDYISALGSSKALMILLESLTTTGINSDYPELMNATLTHVQEIYGRCSVEFSSIVNAWEKIGVSTGFSQQFPGGSYGSCYISGPFQVCEEDEDLTLCFSVQGTFPSQYYKWTMIGKSSNDYQAYGNQIGNNVYGEACLHIHDFPKHPYYSENLTIIFRPTSQGSDFFVRKIKILDCNHDDPTCEEYYNQPRERINMSDSEEDNILTNASKMAIYDIFGRLLFSTNDVNQKIEDLDFSTMVVVVYYNQKGEIVKSQKRIKFSQ